MLPSRDDGRSPHGVEVGASGEEVDAGGSSAVGGPPSAAPGGGGSAGAIRRQVRGRRRRRLVIAAALLAAAGVAAVSLGVRSYLASRPELRRPGEALPEITDRLSKDLPAGAPLPVFVDVTAAAGLGAFRSFHGERTSQLPEDMGSGAAWGDFDDDGDDDLFLVAGGGDLSLPPDQWAPSLLYENLGDGTLRRVESFPDTRILGMGAAWGDADSDGDLDLVVSGYRALLLFRNQDGERFTRDARFTAPEGFWAGVSWADFDRDGNLDLYVCGYVRYQPPEPGAQRVTQQYGAAVPYTLNPASFEPERNLLYRNRGDGSFEEVALEWGVSNPQGRSLSALWHDFDDDGRPDLYVANDISDNALFLNRGDTFEDAGLAAWVADYRGAMGLGVGDWNRDGDDDLFVTHWLAQENALYDSRLRAGRALDPALGLLQPHAGDGTVEDAQVGEDLPALTFTDLSAPLGLGHVSLPVVGWGTEMLDFDADGWLDLVVANGSTMEDAADTRRLVPQSPFLFWNEQGRAFHDLAPQVASLSAPRVGRGLAVSDFDGDGDLDLLLVRLDGGVELLRNDTRQGAWLELRLRRRLPGGGWGNAEGATAVAWIGDVPLRRSVGGVSYLSQSTRVLHFGLGDAARVDRLEVRWPDGEVASYGPLAAGARWEIAQGEPEPRRESIARDAAVQQRAAIAGEAGGTGAGRELDREEVLAFWAAQRAAMDAIKREGDLDKGMRYLGQALALDPDHEDSRYYLAQCLWAEGRTAEALQQLDEMRRRSPGSHRAHRQWAAFAASVATTEAELDAAEAAAQRALEINGEETGALLLLGEIALLQNRVELAGERFALACRTNPKAVDGFFLQAFIAWRQGHTQRARELLARAAEARGRDWKPEGAAAEGDVAARLHREETPLARFWRQWDGHTEGPAASFAPLTAHLEARRGGA
jgi:enediyne biosynthesis protein E4